MRREMYQKKAAKKVSEKVPEKNNKKGIRNRG